MRTAVLMFLLIVAVVLSGCSTYSSYTARYPSGQREEVGKRRYLGIVCGVPRFEYEGLVLSWYESGTNQSAISYSDGLRHGVATNWFGNGNLKYTVTWSMDKRDGPFVIGYPNGQISSRGVFKQEVLDSAEYFNRDGKPITQAEWVRIDGNRAFWR